jgi:hypothetical protein
MRQFPHNSSHYGLWSQSSSTQSVTKYFCTGLCRLATMPGIYSARRESPCPVRLIIVLPLTELPEFERSHRLVRLSTRRLVQMTDLLDFRVHSLVPYLVLAVAMFFCCAQSSTSAKKLAIA